jgi:3-oxoacyl-(acyl-carrier-protein) synthase III
MVGIRETSAIITGVGHYLPEECISSNEVEKRVAANSNGFQMPKGIIQRLTGVANRYYASPNHVSSDLAARAGKMALQNANVDPSDIDILIYASASQDIIEPATANIVQEKIGCFNSHIFDVKNACNSFINALDIAYSFIISERANRILVTTGEILSPSINWKIKGMKELDRKLAALTLGDGGGACLVEASKESDRGIFPGRFYSDGSHWELSTILAGGSLMKNDTSRMYFECESIKLQALATKVLPKLILQVLDDIGWSLHDIKLAVPHQVSLKATQILCEIINFPIDRCVVTLDKVGNTAAASIPIALSLAIGESRTAQNDKILLIGGAAGFSAAVVPVIW